MDFSRTHMMIIRTLWWLVLLVALILLMGCGVTKVKDENGNETTASIAALSDAEDASALCLDDAKGLWAEYTTSVLGSIPTGASEGTIGMLLMAQMFISQDSVQSIINECMTPISVVAREMNLTDRWPEAARQSQRRNMKGTVRS